MFAYSSTYFLCFLDNFDSEFREAELFTPHDHSSHIVLLVRVGALTHNLRVSPRAV